jgi:hypothetical protein
MSPRHGAVEVFKGAPDGKLVAQYFVPAQWRPVCRILRHHRVNKPLPSPTCPGPSAGAFVLECGPIERNAAMAGQSGPTFVVTATVVWR